MIKNKKFAFTLAEVLITLGVIGVVSAITMPTLIQNYQKNVTVNRLKETYSILSQAVKMSEIDNGDITEWEFPKNTAQSHVEWINKYLVPYMKIIAVEEGSEGGKWPAGIVKLANGTEIKIWNGYNENIKSVEVSVMLNGKEKSIYKKSYFVFYIGSTSGNNHLFNDKKGVKPYDFTGGYQNDDLRTILRDAPSYGCNKESQIGKLCSALIMHDGWQIKDDYPW